MSMASSSKEWVFRFLPISRDGITTFCTGALGAMTFGAYAESVHMKMMELNNQLQEEKMKRMLDERDKKKGMFW